MTSFTAYRLFSNEAEDTPEGKLVSMQPEDLSPGNLLIRVAYSSINYKDALAAAGINRIIRHYPRIGGIDLAGEVAASGDPRFCEGDPVVVHGFGIGVDHDGGHAAFARVPAEWAMPLPEGLSLLQAATLGAAGYTAGLCLHWMEHNGLTPQAGKLVVTGATGGVGSIAVNLLAHRGYAVTAVTGKSSEHDFLRRLGASDVMSPDQASAASKPLESPRWAGAVDTVGGDVLAWLLRTMQADGRVTSVGNAGGAALATTVLPFILRGVQLIGINANSPMPLREKVWRKLAGEYRAPDLDAIASLIDLNALPGEMAKMRDRATRGRTVIRMPHP